MITFDLLKSLRDAPVADLADIALRLAVHDSELFLQLRGAAERRVRYLLHRGSGEYLTTLHLSEQEVNAIKLAGQNGKIAAIKAAREITHTGLLEATLLVETQQWFS
jgi:ribosomal protein L7/L12